MRNIFLVDGAVGTELLAWLIDHYIDDLALVVHLDENSDVEELCSKFQLKHTTIEQLDLVPDQQFDFGFTIWWPDILPPRILDLATRGFFNTHPSLLPAQRGKGTSFWNIIEESPFGATIHKIGKKIDDGDIVAQVEITKTWEDTGGSLAAKSQLALSDLFKSWYPNSSGNESIQIDNKIVETFHLLKEIPSYSSLDLDATMTVRNLLNLLRAKVHEDYPGCTFNDEGKIFEVQIKIKEIAHG